MYVNSYIFCTVYTKMMSIKIISIKQLIHANDIWIHIFNNSKFITCNSKISLKENAKCAYAITHLICSDLDS